MTRLAASHVAIFLTAALTATGCASYRLGPVNPAIPAGQAIEGGLFENATPQSGLTESGNASIRRELHRDGTFGWPPAAMVTCCLPAISLLTADPP